MEFGGEENNNAYSANGTIDEGGASFLVHKLQVL